MMMTRQGLLRRSLWVVLASALLVGVSVLLLALSTVPTDASGGTITVTTKVDEYADPGPGQGCSLREAIQAINDGASFGGCDNSGGTADTIQLRARTYKLTRLAAGSYYTNSQGSLYVYYKSVTIRGAGGSKTVISGSASFDDRVFYLVGGTSDPIHVTMEGLTIQGGDITGNGGGISSYIAGANGNSTLTLVDVILKDNQATGGEGGGLYAVYGPRITLENVTITGNQANFGGGIHYHNQYGTEKLRMTNVTISGNQAQNSGGGLYVNFAIGAGAVRATNVTFFNNSAVTGSGDNIYNKGSTIRLKNTIVAGGTDNCAGDPGANITSLGYNLDSGNTCGLTGTGDQVNKAPKLDPLADNGGNTLTHALRPASPAVNHIPRGTNGCGKAIKTDQRGATRPQPAGGACDIGAYELGLLNNSFERGPRIPKYWKGQKLTTKDRRTCTIAHDGSCSFKMVGSTAMKSLKQVVKLSGKAGDAFTLKGWSKATNPLSNGGPYCLQAKVYHTDGTKKNYRACFAKSTHGWQRRERNFTTAKPYKKIVVSLLYYKQGGTAWFDHIQLYVP